MWSEKTKKLSHQPKLSSGNYEKRFYVDPFMNLVMPHQLPEEWMQFVRSAEFATHNFKNKQQWLYYD